ncbi:MAG: LytR/AlgR family response regulator transcription factor [Sinimarinibacterium flocculans]|uniref:LytR/AlgR family response regulator transcription factor n=1 Tax=Sinimarinibacterium flocculans TaxID=985250 RepID=UPI002646C9AC|nr:LytTR family DNA-binding domain-containing protein [Sinimarinibacterium flocculans]MEC9363005.1 LytTR family DNA-binding domain-containing protein [Pseudomonadota bacterium]
MRVVIVDDEPLARERLRRLLQEFPGYEVVGEAGDGETALDVIDDEEPDLVLLDIRMGGIDGLQVGRQLAEMDVPPAVIFTTAYSEHALSAFDASAQGYLLKPIRLEKLRDALQRVRKPTRAQKPQGAAPGDGGKPKREFVLATTRDGLVRVPVDEILYFLADQKYTTVYHLHGEVLIEESLKTLEADFEPLFLRVHRKALVNTRYIAGLERDRQGDPHHWLKLKHVNDPLPVSRRRLAEVRRFLTDT